MLKRLLKRGVVRRIPAAPPSTEGEGGDHTLYQAGSPASYFVLILEGCMEVGGGGGRGERGSTVHVYEIVQDTGTLSSPLLSLKQCKKSAALFRDV